MPGGFYSRLGFAKLKKILIKSEIIVLNRRELKLITGKKYSTGARWLINNGCKLVVATLGEAGCVITEENGQTEIPTIKLSKNKIIDSTGAGDAFTAGLIYGLLTNRSIFGSAFLGNLAGRCCVQGVGARANLPNKNFLEKEYKIYSKVITNG
jgi:ribokinase